MAVAGDWVKIGCSDEPEHRARYFGVLVAIADGDRRVERVFHERRAGLYQSARGDPPS